MNINLIYFTGTGNTRKILDIMTSDISTNIKFIDFTSHSEKINIPAGELTIIAAPSHSGRVPSIFISRLNGIIGNGPVAVVVTYGNRDYDDTLLELQNTAKSRGFKVIAAAAFATQHNLYKELGANRPDKNDIEIIKKFGKDVVSKAEGTYTEIEKVKGNLPYKTFKHNKMLAPRTNSKCTKCGLCAIKCPVNAIDSNNPKRTKKNVCINCMNCVSVCPEKSRHIMKITEILVKHKLKKFINNVNKPEIFI